jgi:hypothetical protein
LVSSKLWCPPAATWSILRPSGSCTLTRPLCSCRSPTPSCPNELSPAAYTAPDVVHSTCVSNIKYQISIIKAQLPKRVVAGRVHRTRCRPQHLRIKYQISIINYQSQAARTSCCQPRTPTPVSSTAPAVHFLPAPAVFSPPDLYKTGRLSYPRPMETAVTPRKSVGRIK